MKRPRSAAASSHPSYLGLARLLPRTPIQPGRELSLVQTRRLLAHDELVVAAHRRPADSLVPLSLGFSDEPEPTRLEDQADRRAPLRPRKMDFG
jgi:hypothetical protein